MFRKIPLYPKLISFGDNVWIASEVSFVTHDVIILSGVTIGCNTVIAAGSVANKSVPGNGVYGGPDGKYICSLDDLG
ncbi:MAG: hypothetical protein LUH21_12815 [Clostridiales bacterium]|nr:hypothetical protein [Clostridiales bacterium]